MLNLETIGNLFQIGHVNDSQPVQSQHFVENERRTTQIRLTATRRQHLTTGASQDGRRTQRHCGIHQRVTEQAHKTRLVHFATNFDQNTVFEQPATGRQQILRQV